MKATFVFGANFRFDPSAQGHMGAGEVGFQPVSSKHKDGPCQEHVDVRAQ